MRVLVLGATGFIGGHIVKAALGAGWQTRGFRRNPASTGHLPGLDIDWCNGDLDDPASLKSAMTKVDVVFHAAGYYPSRKKPRQRVRQLAQHVAYARSQIEAVIQSAAQAGVARLVYTSSLSTIGFPPRGADRLADESDFYQPGDLKGSAYYESKYAMEAALIEAASHGFPVVILNPTAVFGPGDVHLTLGRLLLAAARGQMLAWIPGMVNVVDGRDVAAAHIQATELGVIGERYILGGHNLSLQQAMLQVCEVVGARPPRFGIPLWLINLVISLDRLIPRVNLTGNHLPALIRWRGFDSSKAVLHLGLSARPFAETIKDSLSWFVQHDYLPASFELPA